MMLDWWIGLTLLSLFLGAVLIGLGLIILVVFSVVAAVIAKVFRGLFR